MRYLMIAAALLMTACGSSRASECSDNCDDQTLITACEDSVKECESNSSGALEDLCVELVLDSIDTACGGGDTDV